MSWTGVCESRGTLSMLGSIEDTETDEFPERRLPGAASLFQALANISGAGVLSA
jgi:hypothetical protein